jgi:hypothetical protein
VADTQATASQLDKDDGSKKKKKRVRVKKPHHDFSELTRDVISSIATHEEKLTEECGIVSKGETYEVAYSMECKDQVHILDNLRLEELAVIATKLGLLHVKKFKRFGIHLTMALLTSNPTEIALDMATSMLDLRDGTALNNGFAWLTNVVMSTDFLFNYMKLYSQKTRGEFEQGNGVKDAIFWSAVVDAYNAKGENDMYANLLHENDADKKVRVHIKMAKDVRKVDPGWFMALNQQQCKPYLTSIRQVFNKMRTMMSRAGVNQHDPMLYVEQAISACK